MLPWFGAVRALSRSLRHRLSLQASCHDATLEASKVLDGITVVYCRRVCADWNELSLAFGDTSFVLPCKWRDGRPRDDNHAERRPRRNNYEMAERL